MMENGNSSLVAADKGMPDEKTLEQSVIVRPTPTSSPVQGSGLFYFIWQTNDTIAPFGTDIKIRDRQLRTFFPTESYFAAALGSVVAANSAFSWKLEGPPRVTAKYQEILQYADEGNGWSSLMAKVSIDLYTQDNGAFIEIVREDNKQPDSPVIALNHLDAARCWHTGYPLAPVFYQDRRGRYHLLNWWNVIEVVEMPMPVEGLYGIQMSALTRMLKAAQVLRNVITYTEEKTGGRHNRAVHLLSGITQAQLSDALKQATIMSDSQGLTRYTQPVVVAGVEPEAKPAVATLELSTLPDSFNMMDEMKLYYGIIANAFGRDYQDFSPLPGGNLGSGSQSEILHLKSRGKGPAIYQSRISYAMNFKVLPDNVEFSFDEQDPEAERVQAELRKLRAEERKVRIGSAQDPGEISIAEARQMAMDAGDLPLELFEAGGGLDYTPEIRYYSVSKPEQQAGSESEGKKPPKDDVVAEGEDKPEKQSLKTILRDEDGQITGFIEERTKGAIFKSFSRDQFGRISGMLEEEVTVRESSSEKDDEDEIDEDSLYEITTEDLVGALARIEGSEDLAEVNGLAEELEDTYEEEEDE